MREFKSLKIKCRKGLKFSDVYLWLTEHVKFSSNRFNISIYADAPEKPAEYYDFGFDKFEHILRLPLNSPPERQTLYYKVSNLNDCWQYPNANNQRVLTDAELKELAKLADQKRKFKHGAFQLTFDEIEWDGNPVCHGTYAYMKARADSFAYHSYMSNSLTLFDHFDGFFCYLTFETRFENLEIISRAIEFIGEVKAEDVRYAPNDEAERREWDALQNLNKERMDAALAYTKEMPLIEVSDSRGSNFGSADAIDVRKYIKKYLVNDGWIMRKARADEWPTIIEKKRGDTRIVLSILSGHNGHQIQPMVDHRNEKFYVNGHVYRMNIYKLAPCDVDNYFQNLVKIRDYLYEAL